MKEYLEVKRHDGPARLGKLGDIETPSVVDKNEFEIAPSESIPFNIDEELAEALNKENFKRAEEFILKEKEALCILSGSKYKDLIIDTAKKLEKKGYNGFIIANADELLLRPKNLVELIVNLKNELSPNSYIIFPFIIPQFIPILVYMSVDLFFNDSAEYFSYKNILLTPTKNYNLNKYKLYEMEKEEIFKYNTNTLDFTIREVKEHIKNGTLRNLVEERSTSSPQNISMLKILDREHGHYLDKYTQLY